VSTIASDKFDHWIRTDFRVLNTSLEEIYFVQEDPAAVEGVGNDLKTQLVTQGRAHVEALMAEGDTHQPFDTAFNTLGNLGLFMAALRRHELTNPDRETESPFKRTSALCLRIASSLGVAPRFVSPHLSANNLAIDGVQKAFTNLPDETIFNDYNLYSILYYKRAAEALMHIPALGVSASASTMMLKEAKYALEQVAIYNKTLFDKLDVKRFFYSVRPYFKSHRVGKINYRGANAGDFAGINQIDLLLGLCRGDDLFYGNILAEKMQYMRPEDQRDVQRTLRIPPLMDGFVEALDQHANTDWFQENCRLFLEVCEAHGRTAMQHQNMLVDKFISKPAETMETQHLKQVTASGPPLQELIDHLTHLRDLRIAAPRDDIDTAYKQIEMLKAVLRG